MTTARHIIKLIRTRPHTKAELVAATGRTEKTVRNLLGRIHSNYEHGDQRFAAFSSPGRKNSVYYSILNYPLPRTKKVRGQQFKMATEWGVLEGGKYNTVMYKR